MVLYLLGVLAAVAFADGHYKALAVIIGIGAVHTLIGWWSRR